MINLTSSCKTLFLAHLLFLLVPFAAKAQHGPNHGPSSGLIFQNNDVTLIDGLNGNSPATAANAMVCPTAAEAFISEFHYDNVGTDVGEFVEIAVLNSASVVLADVTVWLYNGSNGQFYNSTTLDLTTVGTNDGTYTYYYWNVVPQNGAPDGIALSCGGVATEFISYEGTFTATNGDANGMTSTSVGQEQGAATPTNSSIQKIGSVWYGTCGHNTKGNTNAIPTASIAATDAVKLEGNSGTTAFTFTVTRGGATNASVTLVYNVTGSGANPADAADFDDAILPSGFVTFAAGSTSETITILVAGDTNIETDEGFTVTLTNNLDCSAEILTATANGTIQDDDAGQTFLDIAATDAVKPEGNAGTTPFTFTVTRSGVTTGTSSVDYAVTGSGANPADANDFGGSFPTGTVNFAIGQTTETITINVTGDMAVEPDEGFTVTLSNPVGASISTAAANGTILDDDLTITNLDIAATDAVKNEGNAGTTAFTFTVTRSGNLLGTSSADYAVTGSGANPADATDFGGNLPSGTINFAAFQTSAVITVNVTGDTDIEPSEDFTVTLSNPVGATINTATANGTILNDDTACPNSSQVFINEFHYDNVGADMNEFAEVAVLNSASVTLSSVTFTLYNGGNGATYGTPRTLDLFTVGANDGTYTYYDFTFPTDGIQNGAPDGFALSCSGLAFEFLSYEGSFTATNGPANGQTSTDVLASETTNSPVGGSVQKIGAAWSTTCSQNTKGNANAVPTISIAATDANKAEGNAGTTAYTFTVTRGGLTTGATTVNFAVTGTGANPASALDFDGGVLPSGNVTFAAGSTSETITILVTGDTDVEPNEEFTVTLTNAVGCGTDLTNATAIGTILDDDGTGGCPTTLNVNGTIASGTYKADMEVLSDGSVGSTAVVSFRAGNSVTLQPNFEVILGGQFEALIEACVPMAPEADMK